MLIGSLIGVERRTTKDLDTTVRGFTLTHEKIREVFGEICEVELEDDLSFELIRTEDIREVDEYPGIRIFIKAHYPPLAVPLAVDVTTGDKITPDAITYDYPFTFDEGHARIMAYPVETVLAEKMETILSRGVSTTRIRDFYDVYELWRVRFTHVDAKTLGAALAETCSKRNSVSSMQKRAQTLESIRADEGLLRQWEQYASKHSYTSAIRFPDAIDAVETVSNVVAPYFFEHLKQ